MSETTTIVIFGASGDLTRRKLIPALYDLYIKDRMPEQFQIVGVSRSELSNEDFRARSLEGVKEFGRNHFSEETWEPFAERIFYHAGNLTHVTDMRELDKVLAKEEGDGSANRVYYLSIAPKLYEKAIENLAKAEMVTEDNGWRRVVVEKPFGHDLDSAVTLNEFIHQYLEESQIYRIDHYLGKETVQNIMVVRFANSLFEPVWNRNYISHVQITAAETVDVGHRADYYDGVGVVRDMVQNHMLQLLTLVASEPPASSSANDQRNEKVKVLNAIRPIKADDVAQHTVRGQYRSYRDAEGVAPGSETATFVAIRFFIDNWRWQGVPFYLRSGKALAEKSTDITIYFKEPPHLMFPLEEGAKITANSLSICIQPDEGIHFNFQAKVPDTTAEMRSVDMSFHYDNAFGISAIPEAYERLLLDILKGDQSLFSRADAIELAWSLIDPILQGWTTKKAPPLAFYESGSWGPVEADTLIQHDGFNWGCGCVEHD